MEKRLWTYDELLAVMPETNVPSELWDGELIMSPMPSPDHQRYVQQFALELQRFVNSQNLGEVFTIPLDVVLTSLSVVQPDVLYVSKANKRIIEDRIRGVPDLVAEVIYGTLHRDTVCKKALYEQFGVKEYWLIDPERRSIEALELVEGAYRLHERAMDADAAHSKLLPGFAVSFNHLVL